ncbi:unnamed protein product, partial [Cuscuta europaea]
MGGFWSGFKALEWQIISTGSRIGRYKRKALTWIKQQDWGFVDVESDASRVIYEIREGSSVSASGLVAGDIRDIRFRFTNICFHYIWRSANKVANESAKTACSTSDGQLGLCYP